MLAKQVYSVSGSTSSSPSTCQSLIPARGSGHSTINYRSPVHTENSFICYITYVFFMFMWKDPLKHIFKFTVETYYKQICEKEDHY